VRCWCAEDWRLAVLVGLGVAAGGASASTVNWSGPALIDHQQPFATTPAIERVACPSAHLCVGLQQEGVVTSTNPAGGAAAWHAASFLGIHGYTGAVFGALACAPSTHFCAAADEVGDLMTTTNAAGGAGNPTHPSSWTATKIDSPLPGFNLGPASLTGVSCVSSGPCFAIDAVGKVVVGQVTG
jgi:hypothetical protein